MCFGRSEDTGASDTPSNHRPQIRTIDDKGQPISTQDQEQEHSRRRRRRRQRQGFFFMGGDMGLINGGALGGGMGGGC